jgi:hypothetical protein
MVASRSDEKTAEFARLFNLFERLASRRAITADTGTILDDVRSLPVPADLAPVFKNLATIVGTRTSTRDTSPHPGGRPRRNTVAVSNKDLAKTASDMDTDDEECDDEASLAKFPLGKQYPFTFKLMLHKLYQLDDWAKKVKDVLERSQLDYKPLAEQVEPKKNENNMDVVVEKDGHVRFQPGVITGGGRRGSLAVRPRSHSTAGVGRQPEPKSPRGVEGMNEARALKKRCVGRRKSMTEQLAAESGRLGGWIYDAAVSSVERQPVVTFVALPPAQEARSRYQFLEGGKKPRPMKRRVSAGAPGDVLQRMPLKHLTNAETASTRRRALTVCDLSHQSQQKQTKSPFMP